MANSPSFGMGLLTNPFFAIGSGLLQSSGPSLTPTNPWGGITQGLLAAEQAKRYQAQNEMDQLRIAALQRQDERRARAEEFARASGVPGAEIDPIGYARLSMERQFATPEMTTVYSTETGAPQMVPATQAPELVNSGAFTPNAPTAAPAKIQLYRQVHPEDPELRYFDAWDREQRRAGASSVNVNTGPKLPAGYMWADAENPSLGVIPIPGGPATRPTDAQSMAAGYRDRMASAESIMSDLTTSGYDPANTRDRAAIASGLEVAQSDAGKQYRQAQEDWVRAKLRKESGAVIADDEMEREIRTYFPVWGDPPEVQKQKARARMTAIEGMKKSSGPSSGGLTPGAIEDGYRYIGGNPASPSSWEPAQ